MTSGPESSRAIKAGQRVEIRKSGTVISQPWEHIDFGRIVWVLFDDEPQASIISAHALRKEE